MIIGWAVTGGLRSSRHALREGTDIGGFGAALCGTHPNPKTGWTEPPQEEVITECRKCARRIAEGKA